MLVPLRLSNEHILIVRVLRARRMSSRLLRPRRSRNSWLTLKKARLDGTRLAAPHRSTDLPRRWPEVRVELVLIHPFREGNGRAAGILAVLMGLQAGLPALLFDKLSGRKRQYFAAGQAGLDRNYDAMTILFTAVIERTLQVYEKTS